MGYCEIVGKGGDWRAGTISRSSRKSCVFGRNILLG